MAARLRVKHQDEVRAKIQGSQLVNRLQGHALGRIDMTKTQIQAAMILLRKVLPDLVSVSAEPGTTAGFLIMGQPESADSTAWEAQHGQPDPVTPAA